MYRSRAIRALRPTRPRVDPRRPIGTLLEDELMPGGGRASTLTIFLAGAECPFTCVFCDLWQHTLDRPTKPGDLPAQVEIGLAELATPERDRLSRLKLYNASNFFDPRSVPATDLPTLAGLAAPFQRVVVECHPRLIGPTCFAWADGLAGELEVAMGLETIHPQALPRLGKQATLDDFDRAAASLATHGIALRCFVLVGAPYIPRTEAAEWAVRSAKYAFDRGAESVALIPVRGGNGELERLESTGDFHPPRLADLETALDGVLEIDAVRSGRGVVSADLWDLEQFADCPGCFTGRRRRLERINTGACPEPRVDCDECSR